MCSSRLQPYHSFVLGSVWFHIGIFFFGYPFRTQYANGKETRSVLMEVDCWGSPQIPLYPFYPFVRPSPGHGRGWTSVASAHELCSLGQQQAPLVRMRASSFGSFQSSLQQGQVEAPSLGHGPKHIPEWLSLLFPFLHSLRYFSSLPQGISLHSLRYFSLPGARS